MSLTKYRAFIRVAELGSITKAAMELSYSQPGISHMISALEKQFGFPLLVRSKDSAVLTKNGEKVLYYCKQVIAADDKLQNEVNSLNGLIVATINICAYNSMLLRYIPKAITGFVAAHPDVKLMIEETGYEDAWKNLSDGKIDLAFMSDLVPAGFEFKPLFQDTLGMLVSVKHPFAKLDKISIDMLNGCDYIMSREAWDDVTRQIVMAKSFQPKVKHYVASDTAGIALVNSNMGVYPVSNLMKPIIPDTIRFVEFEEEIHRNLGLCAKSFTDMSPEVKALVKCIIDANKNTRLKNYAMSV